MKKENEIDQLFKKGMEHPDIPFNELDWKKMTAKLDAHKVRKRPSIWIYAGSGIAAASLLILFLFLFDQRSAVSPTKQVNTKSKPWVDAEKETPPSLVLPADEMDKENLSSAHLNSKYQKPTPGLVKLKDVLLPSASVNTAMLKGTIPTPILSTNNISVSRTIPDLLITQLSKLKAPQENAVAGIRDNPELQQIRGGKLTLSVLAAPDVTSSKTSVGTKISSNLGVLLSYPLGKQLSISSGAVFARKLYDYGGGPRPEYSIAAGSWELNADCYVIDVPVNVNYQVLKKRDYIVSINSGLSSYFMLKEKYNYRSTDLNGVEQRTAIEINNQNQHIFGIANFSISIDRKVSDKVSVGIQPFLKVPLTGIGNYDYYLRSKGVAVSLSIKPFGVKK